MSTFLLIVITVLMVIYWLIRRVGVKAHQRGYKLRRELRRKALDHINPEQSSVEESRTSRRVPDDD